MPNHLPSIVAIDLGAESCRVSLLRWEQRRPRVDLVYRFSNAPIERDGRLRWDFKRICAELEKGLQLCAEQTSGPIASIGVDGWAVDYVRLDKDGKPCADPYCYRDTRTEAAEAEVRKHVSAEELFMLGGAQPLRLNTLFQLVADKLAGVPDGTPWVNLPEYVLMHLGGERISEFTNATHTGLVDAKTQTWCEQIFPVADWIWVLLRSWFRPELCWGRSMVRFPVWLHFRTRSSLRRAVMTRLRLWPGFRCMVTIGPISAREHGRWWACCWIALF